MREAAARRQEMNGKGDGRTVAFSFAASGLGLSRFVFR